MKNLIKFLAASFVMAVLLFVSCQSDENQVVENPDVLSNNSTLTSRLKRLTFTNDITSIDNALDSTSCFKVKFPYFVDVNGNSRLPIESEVDYAEVVTIFNLSHIDQDQIEFVFPITVITLENAEIVVNNEQEFRALSVSCEHSEVVFPCLNLRFPITIYSYDANFQIQQTHVFNTSSEIYAFLTHLGDGEFYQIRYPLNMEQPNGESLKLNSNAELLLAIENAFDICYPPVIPCENQQILTNGLIVYMPFANEAKDLVSNTNALVHDNFPPVFVTDRNGNANSAISMGGEGQEFLGIPETENNHLKQGDSITISVWFMKKSENGRVVGFFQKSEDCVCNTGFNAGYLFAPYFGQETGGALDSGWANDPALTTDTRNWHHFVVTVAPGNQVKLYRDGALRTETVMENLDIGSWLGTYIIGKNFNGYLDDLRVYRKTLTAEQVQMLYNLEGDTNTCF